jgi:hypothetical protein
MMTSLFRGHCDTVHCLVLSENGPRVLKNALHSAHRSTRIFSSIVLQCHKFIYRTLEATPQEEESNLRIENLYLSWMFTMVCESKCLVLPIYAWTLNTSRENFLLPRGLPLYIIDMTASRYTRANKQHQRKLVNAPFHYEGWLASPRQRIKKNNNDFRLN